MLAALRRGGAHVTTLSIGPKPSATLLRRLRADVVIVDTIAAPTAGSLIRAARASGARIVTLALMSRGAVRLAHESDRVIAVSRALAGELRDAGIPRSRIAVIPPGIDRARPAARWPSERGLCVANWTRAKGIRTLLAAIERLPDVQLDLVGDTPDPVYARQVRADLQRAPFRARVRVHGVMRGARLQQMYARASFFVLPSTVESYGMAVGDALGAGLPIIACDIPATREVTGGAAVLVPRGRVNALSDAIAHVSSDAVLRGLLARRARERAKRLSTWEQSEKEFVRAVGAIVASARR